MKNFYDKFVVSLSKTAISDEAFKQYNHISDEIQTLCELTSSDWGLIHEPWFCKVRKGYFIGGVMFAVGLGGIAYGGYKLIKSKTSSQSKEEG